jgi:hypothetical protein
MAYAKNDEKVFAEGFSFKRQDNAPDFVVGRLSVKCDEAIQFMKEHQSNGWVNFNIKYAKSGNPYVELDTWKPTGETASHAVEKEEELPF